MRPSVGRIVHYVPDARVVLVPDECQAAIVTEVQDFEPGSTEEPRAGEVGLCVLNPEGMFFNRNVPHDEGRAPGTWHWPERVPE